MVKLSTPPHERRIKNYGDILAHPLQKERDTRRAEHISSKDLFPPIHEGLVASNVNEKQGLRKPKIGGSSRPTTAQFFEAAKYFHTSKDANKELRHKLMESHMTFMNWRVPTSRPSSVMSTKSARPGTSAARLNEARKEAKKSPYTNNEVPSIETERLAAAKVSEVSPRKKPLELSEKDAEMVKDWVNKASAAEKAVIQSLVESADRLTLTTVTGRKFRPGMSQALRLWLESANEAEKSIASSFLENMELLQSLESPRSTSYERVGFGPLIDKKTLGYRDSRSDKELEGIIETVSRELDIPVTWGKTSPRTAHGGIDKTPAALWHLDPNRDPQRQVLNSTSNFVNPNRNRGTHFDIHPDWPSFK